jgi:hypothetical protein
MKKLVAYLSRTFATQLAREAAVATVIGLIVLFIIWHTPKPKPVILHPNAATTSVIVQKDALAPKEVVKYVQDETEVKRLLAENKKLKQQVTQLSETIAKTHSTGQGTITTVPRESVPEPLRPTVAPATPTSSVWEFTDWRLHFVASGNSAKYDLSQTFEVLSTTGRDKDGKPVSKTKLFEVGPGEKRTEITDLKTTNIFADAARLSWHLGATLQAGIGYGTLTTDTSKKGAIAVAGLQWLKRGRTEAAEDSTLSLFTPVAMLSDGDVEFGVLPVSVNLGRIPYQPLKDLWVSPYIGKNAQKPGLGHVGVVFTASF